MNEITQDQAKSYRFWFRTLAAASMLSALVTGCEYTMGYTKRLVPYTTNVTQNSVIPSKLELECLEGFMAKPCTTIAEYDGKKFLLQYDGKQITGKPYEVKPVEQK